MGTTPCLYSRGRSGKPAAKKVRGFLALPGELRNKIYRYYFESECRCEVAAQSSRFDEHRPRIVSLWAGVHHSDTQVLKYESKVQKESPATIRISRLLGKYTIVKGLQTNWFTSLFAINLVCKQIHGETLPFIYKKTTFVFDAPVRITNFLNVVSKQKLEHITKLQLHYSTYGAPSWTKDRIWQEKHAQSWMRALTQASKRLVALQTLKIWIALNEYSPSLTLREPWVLPLLQFRRLTCASKASAECAKDSASDLRPKTLKVVDIVFRSRVSGCHFEGNTELAQASDDLHQLFGHAISAAILAATEEEAMADFEEAWNGKYQMWQFFLGFGMEHW
ncbi:hypothetical protein FB567DRAFT_540139 [Paraphoma chrysanthemicola]|uniref:DUF7730 domain-containing protein n=1 Tax=Paraphoma chrysanthemicola TaxID=798071 RepID=A0A8K0QUK2_9PLEO|nr:hypothetical protein FB567DRAFT_540139 [Paraphoma chrysanthemicola]